MAFKREHIMLPLIQGIWSPASVNQSSDHYKDILPHYSAQNSRPKNDIVLKGKLLLCKLL